MEHATEDYVGWLNDPKTNRYLETRFRPQSLSTLRAFIERQIENPTVAFFAIHDGDNGRFLGSVKLSDIKEQHRSGVVGYFVGDQESWGRGIGTNAVGALCTFSMRQVGLKKIRASCYSGNLGSIRVLQKIGFTQEGRQRYQVEGPCGREDILDFGLTEHELNFENFPAIIE